MSSIVVMGSGETTPTMLRVHRDVFARCPPGPAVMLDTPFAFQMNRDELVERTRGYFSQSVGRDVEVARWPHRRTDDATKERALALLDQAVWAFAGPGSPTYALRQWRDTAVPSALASVVRRGGTVVMGSAAALTLGSHCVPVYEIYKVGETPSWVDGLDLLGELTGLRAAVIPHYDNAEGGTHDTRYCYLGGQRLALLEADLPTDVAVIGVDEHTAVVFDLESSTVRVFGHGVLSLRRRGDTATFGAGEEVTFADVGDLLRGARAASAADKAAPTGASSADQAGAPGADEPGVAVSLRDEAERARTAFDAALRVRDAQGCVAAVLGLEAALAAWSADTLQSDDTNEARRVLRALVVRLGELAEHGVRDPRELVRPYVDVLIEQRSTARAAGDFATSDSVRDRLVDLGVEVRDTPDGTEWDLSAAQPTEQ